ncbi:Glyoxylase, beta-lactamase superfamily II [Roseomonas rosea]|uniref:Glyoxylase, beta-lactamase superfamily II n=1 Tax=Muricoccus roseus TaxID=198092 RepID=A0A1M6KZZ2_9PROT|nr:MBL fold metallo-hydrolase [Roseomonas rosea]SHJ64454.1 Glyoxylase, beta-lactamase superfamily II [Roseomonas rosea]
MRIHSIECGSMRPFGGRLWDGETRGFGPAHLACRCLLAETEAGLVLIDTGFGLEDVNQPVPRLNTAFYLADRVHLEADETAISRIRQLGLDPRDVRHIVMTHLDFDHAGGLTDFPWATVHVHAVELAASRRRAGAIARGRYRPAQLAHPMEEYSLPGPMWFGLPTIRGLEGLPPSIFLVPLPGHTAGHCGVALETPQGWVLHAGDTVFMHSELEPPMRMPPLAAAYANVMQVNREARLQSRRMLRALAREHGDEVTILCTHDPVLPSGAAARLVTQAGAGVRAPEPAPPSA